MDLRDLRQFLAVAEELHFGRAAARLHIAQPPLSRNIKALELELGTPLFVRNTRGVELTEAGLALLDEAPNLLSLAQRAKERTQRAGQGLSGVLDVGLFGSAILDVIPQMLARFHARRPGVRIRLHSLSKADQLQALRERRLAVAFNRLVPPEADLVVETLLREPLMVALPRRHRLAALPRVGLQDLAAEPLILYPAMSMRSLAQEIVDAFRRENLTPHVGQAAEDVLTAIALVAGGFGLAITTRSATNLRLPGVVFRPLQARHLREIDLSCIFRRGDTGPVLTAFLEVVREVARQEQAPAARGPRAAGRRAAS